MNNQLQEDHNMLEKNLQLDILLELLKNHLIDPLE